MYRTLAARFPRDADMPARAWRIGVLRAVLTGRLYDVLHTPFHVEVNDAGEPIRLLDRRPSVRTGWCRTVVEDSASLVFDDSHFPAIDCADEPTREMLRRLAKETGLAALMLEAVVKGAVGSVAILLRILKSRVYFEVLGTETLTPFWDPEAPDTLIRVREQYKVKGADLQALGYRLEQPDAVHWFRRDWTAEAEEWYLPWPVDGDVQPMLDPERSKNHGLGFVPMVWIRNLPGGDEIDGAPTVPDDAINTMIEADYQLSQAGRGLRYSADPKLVIKGQPETSRISLTKALVLPDGDSDAKLLEIDGDAVARVIDYVRCLREIALEAMHGNRADPQKLAGAQSGRAMELMNQALISLAGRLRTSYGETGLLSLLQLVVRAGQILPLSICGRLVEPGTLSGEAPLSLKWPSWYAPTAQDRLASSQAIKTARDAGIMSVETGIAAIAHDYDIEDQPAERAQILAELNA